MGNREPGPEIEDRSVLMREARVPDHLLTYGTLPDQVADCYLSADPGEAATRPLLLLIHGGYWRPPYDRVHLRTFASALAGAGWQVASIEYRRIPGDPDAMVADIRAAITTLPAQFAGRSDQVIVIGHSAGGHLALWAAAQVDLGDQIAGVIALGAVSDLELAQQLDLDDGGVRDFLGCAAKERLDLDPMHLPPVVPVINLHGTLDSRVPIALARNYLTAHVGDDVTLIEIDDVAHFELIDPTSVAWPMVLAAVRDTRTTPPPC